MIHTLRLYECRLRCTTELISQVIRPVNTHKTSKVQVNKGRDWRAQALLRYQPSCSWDFQPLIRSYVYNVQNTAEMPLPDFTFCTLLTFWLLHADHPCFFNNSHIENWKYLTVKSLSSKTDPWMGKVTPNSQPGFIG